MRILVIEDDARTAAYLLRGLGESGHIVDAAGDGLSGLEQALEGIYDALVVDRLLPGLDGLTVVRKVRHAGLQMPILMLSALASTVQRVEGLKAGCDDYLGKPYAFAELLARLDALLRTRNQPPGPARSLRVGNLRLNCAARTVFRQGKAIALQQREALILEKLMRHCNEVVTRSMLLESAWDYAFDPHDNVVDKHIHRLRKKLDADFDHPLIETVPGAGYRLLSEVDPLLDLARES